MIRIRIKLSALLGDRRIKQTELARLTGLSTTTINRYYNEVIERVDLDYLAMICEALHCDISDLLCSEPVGGDVSSISDHAWERQTRLKKMGR